MSPTPTTGSPDPVRVVDVINLSSSANTLLRERVLAMRAQGMDNRIVCIDGKYVPYLRELGIPVHTIELPRGVEPFRMLLTTFELAAYLRRENIDLVHTHCSMPGVLGRIAAWLAGVPVIIHTIHGLHVHDRWSGPMRELYTFAERLCGRFTDLLLSQNQTDLELARRLALVQPGRLRFIGNGIDLGRFRPGHRDPGGPLTIVCTARLEPVKNHAMLFTAVRTLRSRGVPVKVWLIGDGELRDDYAARCAEWGIGDAVEFLGYRDDVPSLLQRAHVSVLTSVKEGIPRALLESMAMKLPVVATRVVGTDETVRDGETGYLVELDDADGLADRLEQLHADPALRERLGARGRQVVEAEFDEAAIVRSLATHYRQLLLAKGLGAQASRLRTVEP